jgi:hypothetical protein
MGSNKEHNMIGKAHRKAVRAGRRIMHAMRNGHLYRSLDGLNWGLEENPATVGPVPEGATLVTECPKDKSNKNK